MKPAAVSSKMSEFISTNGFKLQYRQRKTDKEYLKKMMSIRKTEVTIRSLSLWLKCFDKERDITLRNGALYIVVVFSKINVLGFSSMVDRDVKEVLVDTMTRQFLICLEAGNYFFICLLSSGLNLLCIFNSWVTDTNLIRRLHVSSLDRLKFVI